MENNERLTPEAMAKLAEPFAPECVGKLPKGGVMLDYVGHANITARLNAVDPLWTWQPFAVDEHGLPAMDYNAAGQPVGMWIYLTIFGKTLPAYGDGKGQKEIIGDALRNGAMRFGVGLYLWSKDELEGCEVPATATPAPRQQPAPASQRAPQAAGRTNGHANGHNHQNGANRPQNGTQRPTAPALDGDPVSPINELCRFAGSIGMADPTPPNVQAALVQMGADFKAVTRGNLEVAKIHIQQFVEGVTPDDDAFGDGV